MADVLVLVETREGRVKIAGLEALSAARRLAGDDGRVAALVIGAGAERLAGECGRHGADRTLVAAGEAFTAYAPEAWRDALLAGLAAHPSAAVLAAATPVGLEVLARAAARLDRGLLSDVVELGRDGTALVATRPVYAGKAQARVRLEGEPGFATLRPNVFPIVESPRRGTLTALTVAAVAPRARVVRIDKPEEQELDVAEAEVVVSGGRGLKGPEHFHLVRDLARVLGGAVGASRAVVDAGWIGHAHQVGQTGKTVSPRLYVALGISGAIQHLAGMSSSKVIVAINKDPDAPIFKHASYGIVGDVFEIVPELVKALAAHKARHA